MSRIIHFLLIIITGLTLTVCNVRNSTSENNSQELPEQPVAIVPDILIPQLPGRLNESSGLILFRDLFWTINDSGGEAALYGFNRETGEVRQVVRIENAENDDWESLTSSQQHIYIGDFGNNWGDRKNLGIYIVDKSDIPEAGDVTLVAEKINFSYSDQENFTFGTNNNPYDCEAFIWLRDSLFLFTKDWVTRNTKVYALPAKPGTYIVEPVDSFAVEFLVTGADISSNRERLVLLGYADYVAYIRYFEGIDENNLFGDRSIKFSMIEYFGAQTEGIVFSGNDTLFISSEHSQTPSRIYRYVLPGSDVF